MIFATEAQDGTLHAYRMEDGGVPVEVPWSLEFNYLVVRHRIAVLWAANGGRWAGRKGVGR